jgi:hypothetical protein
MKKLPIYFLPLVWLIIAIIGATFGDGSAFIILSIPLIPLLAIISFFIARSSFRKNNFYRGWLITSMIFNTLIFVSIILILLFIIATPGSFKVG